MLDSFEVVTVSGVVLWSKTFAPVGINVVNSLIQDIFIQGNTTSIIETSAARIPTYKKDKYTLKWTTAKDLGLIFVVRQDEFSNRQIPTTKTSLGCVSVSSPPHLDRHSAR